MFFIVFGWRKEPEPKGEWLLPCEVCKRVERHLAYHVKRRFTLYSIPVFPLWWDRLVVCRHCEHERRVTRDEEGQLEETSNRLWGVQRRLRRLQELDPIGAEQVLRELAWGRITLNDMDQRVDRAFEVAEGRQATPQEQWQAYLRAKKSRTQERKPPP
jgi:hypothetical protein